MGKVGIVCDSTCDMGPEWLAAHDVVMLPLKVLFDDRTFLDWIDLTPSMFFQKLAAASALPKTSQPSPADFAAVYETLAGQGCEGIVSIHLSAALSGTLESATLAAAGSRIPVRIIDTLTVSAGESLVIRAALDTRTGGGDLDAIEAAARHVVDTGTLLFALDTLDYLVKGGRAGKAQGLASSLLNIKPVLTFNREGIIEPYKNIRGTKKAIAEIANTVAEASRTGTVKVAYLHTIAPDLVEELDAEIKRKGCSCEVIDTISVGAVIGTYAGPRAVGAAFCPAW